MTETNQEESQKKSIIIKSLVISSIATMGAYFGVWANDLHALQKQTITQSYNEQYRPLTTNLDDCISGHQELVDELNLHASITFQMGKNFTANHMIENKSSYQFGKNLENMLNMFGKSQDKIDSLRKQKDECYQQLQAKLDQIAIPLGIGNLSNTNNTDISNINLLKKEVSESANEIQKFMMEEGTQQAISDLFQGKKKTEAMMNILNSNMYQQLTENSKARSNLQLAFMKRQKKLHDKNIELINTEFNYRLNENIFSAFLSVVL